MRTMITALMWALGGYLVYCAFLFVMQRQMLFPRSMIVAPVPLGVTSARVEKFWLETDFGQVEAWFIPPRTPAPNTRSPVLIYAHGNAELIDFWPAEFSKLARRGMGVLLVEYPGYGRSQGSPGQASITAAFSAAYDTITARPDIDPHRVILFGTSLGGGAVCALAARRPAAALILMSTFTSIRSMAAKYLAPGFLVRDPFDNLAVVAAYPGPTLIVHGQHDTLIPYSHGLKLSRAAVDGRMITYPGDHNDCPPSWEILFQEIEGFLTSHNIL